MKNTATVYLQVPRASYTNVILKIRKDSDKSSFWLDLEWCYQVVKMPWIQMLLDDWKSNKSIIEADISPACGTCKK